jgi:hypothetical protein
MRNKHLTLTQRYIIEVTLKVKVTKKDIWPALKITSPLFIESLSGTVKNVFTMLNMFKYFRQKENETSI